MVTILPNISIWCHRLKTYDMKQQQLPCVEFFIILHLAIISKARNTQNNIFGNSITKDEL
jgi:hypothetical protein